MSKTLRILPGDWGAVYLLSIHGRVDGSLWAAGGFGVFRDSFRHGRVIDYLLPHRLLALCFILVFPYVFEYYRGPPQRYAGPVSVDATVHARWT